MKKVLFALICFLSISTPLTVSAAEEDGVRTIPLTQATIQMVGEQNFQDQEIEPKVIVKLGDNVLIEGTDYTVDYKDNEKVGTATIIVTGDGEHYSGRITSSFVINPASITNFSLEGVEDEVYTGLPIQPEADFVGNTYLEDAIDYTVSYEDNIDVGKAKMIVTGKGNYCDTVTVVFNIVKENISNCYVDTIKAVKFNGKPKYPKVIINGDEIRLVENRDYTVTYTKNVRVGEAKITITGIGNFTGSMQEKFSIKDVDESKIRPRKPLLRLKKNALTITNRKDDIISGIMIYTKNSKGKWVRISHQKNFRLNPVSMKVKAGRIYSFRVRTYIIQETDKIYSPYTKTITYKPSKNGKFYMKPINKCEF